MPDVENVPATDKNGQNHIFIRRLNLKTFTPSSGQLPDPVSTPSWKE